jgi:hypothetical protein
MGKQLNLSNHQMDILRVAKKKRRVSSRDFNWWTLVDMMHQGALHRVDPREGSGWPHFILSPKGRSLLKKIHDQKTA